MVLFGFRRLRMPYQAVFLFSFTDMHMSTSMYEIFNWTEGVATSATPISSSPAQVTRSNSSYFGIYIYSICDYILTAYILFIILCLLVYFALYSHVAIIANNIHSSLTVASLYIGGFSSLSSANFNSKIQNGFRAKTFIIFLFKVIDFILLNINFHCISISTI